MFADAVGETVVPIERRGVISLVQRPGETLVFQEGFEERDDDALDHPRGTGLGR